MVAVSVIVPIYNGEAFLAETIDSVLAQDFRDFEILLIDDGSQDGSPAIAQAYAQSLPFIRYLEHPGRVNRGVTATRNLGLREAKGEFIAPLSQDDVWDVRTKLSEQLALFAAHPEAALVCGAELQWGSWSGGEDWLMPIGHDQDAVISPPEASKWVYPLGRTYTPNPSGWLLRRDAALALGGFDENFVGRVRMYEDVAFLSKLYLDYPVYFSSRRWILYRLHDNAVSTQDQPLYDEARSYFLHWFRDYVRGRTVHPEVLQRIKWALRPYDHPRLLVLLNAFARLRRRLGLLPPDPIVPATPVASNDPPPTPMRPAQAA